MGRRLYKDIVTTVYQAHITNWHYKAEDHRREKMRKSARGIKKQSLAKKSSDKSSSHLRFSFLLHQLYPTTIFGIC
jgi:hypothetical protein